MLVAIVSAPISSPEQRLARSGSLIDFAPKPRQPGFDQRDCEVGLPLIDEIGLVARLESRQVRLERGLQLGEQGAAPGAAQELPDPRAQAEWVDADARREVDRRGPPFERFFPGRSQR